jgi:fucose permease
VPEAEVAAMLGHAPGGAGEPRGAPSAPPAPEDRRARLAVAAMFVANGALGGTFAARIPSIAEDLHASPAQLGLALFSLAVGAIVALPLAGRQAAHHGSRPGMIFGVALMSAALPVAALAPSVALLAVVLFCFGFTSAFLDVSMNAHGVAVESRYGRPILSSFHAFWSLGALGAAALGAVLAGAGVPPLVHFGAVSVAIAATGLLATRWLLPRDADRADEPPGFHLPPRPIAIIGILAFCGLFGEGAASDWGAIYVAGPLAAGPAIGALAYAGFALTMTVGRFVGDRLVLRFGSFRVTRFGATLGSVGLAVALLVGHPIAAVLGLMCLGAGLASVVPIVFRAAGSSPLVPPGVGIASVATIGYAGMLAGPPTIGFVAELVGLPVALGIVVVLVGLLAVFARHVATPGEVVTTTGARGAAAPVPRPRPSPP